MTNSNQPPHHDHLSEMLARYRVAPDAQPTPEPPHPVAPVAHDQPMTRREAKSRQNNSQHDGMEDQSIWGRAKKFVLPAVLVLCLLLSVYTRVF